MKKIPDLLHSLLAKVREKLEQRPKYASLCEQIEDISLRTKDAVTEDARDMLKAQLDNLYYRRRRLREDELKRHQRNQRRVYNAQRGAYDEGDWRRSHFDRVIRYMVLEGDRLADTLALAVPLRSPQGISALQDLVALLVDDSRVAYQDVFRPAEGRCPVPSCAVEIESIPLQGRWDHVYRCRKGLLKAKHGFAKFCFLCNVWMTSAADWETHCQDHIDDMDVPFRCNPITPRRALARNSAGTDISLNAFRTTLRAYPTTALFHARMAHAQGAVLKYAGEGHPMNDAVVLEHARLPAKDLDDIQTTDPQLLTIAMLTRSPGQAIDATVPDESMTLAEEKRNFLRGTSDIGEFMVADQVEAQHPLTNARLHSGSGRTRMNSRARLYDGGQVAKRQSDRSTSARKTRGVHVSIIYDGREVRPGDYVVIACDRDGDETECIDRPDIARVEDIRLDGRLGVT
ncbi:hypothetical protein F5Y09DRAFT_340281 [Xylaria sp. FL1042]|nr:hypothetical protein F5Y09DRAFT_340281 [Xylaria sp. FL1042]